MSTTPFYAVTYEVRHTVPGDERSRTHPGHGYPEHTVSTQALQTFDSIDQLKEWVLKEHAKSYGRVKYTALMCTPLSVGVETIVSIAHAGDRTV